MKLEDIEDPIMRYGVARLQITYWRHCTVAAARIHPNWAVKGGEPKWLGGRTGPRTENGLLNWYLTNYPKECELIQERIAALAEHYINTTTDNAALWN
jgi:hypothetical protein